MDLFMKIIAGLLGAIVGAAIVVLLAVIFVPLHQSDFGFARLDFVFSGLPIGVILGIVLGVHYRNRLKDKQEEMDKLAHLNPDTKDPDDWRYH